ncbi:MAG: restriction endonuclease subunit S [Prevotella sp.]|nr:restriction endonuclease subunit S [Prevotella sp.]
MKYVKVKDLGQIVTGNTPPTSDMSNYGNYMPFIKATDIILGSRYTYVTEQGYSEKSYKKYKANIVPKGSTCIVTIGSIGKKITQAHTDLFVNQAINAILPYKQYDKDYIYYATKYAVLPQLKIYDSGTTSGRENISKSSFSNIRLYVEEDFSTQQKIASILSAYDRLIENNTHRICLLEQMAENLYKEWFIRFRFPGHENVEMVNGLPKGWKVERIKECVKRLHFGRTYKAKELSQDGEIIVIDQSTSDFLGFHNNAPDHHATFNSPIILFGDHSCKFCLMTRDFSLGENIIPFISKDTKQIDNYYLYFATHKLIVTEEYKRHWGRLSSMKILIPTIDIQQKFNKLIIKNEKMKKLLFIQNQLLTRQRDLLLPRLMSGKLEVKS